MSYIISIVLSVLCIVSMWKLFEKAGEAGWKIFIPLYNSYILFKITWGNGWYFLLMLIPIANIVISIITMVKLAHVFGKSGGFAVGLIFLTFIFVPILGLGDAVYVGVQNN